MKRDVEKRLRDNMLIAEDNDVYTVTSQGEIENTTLQKLRSRVIQWKHMGGYRYSDYRSTRMDNKEIHMVSVETPQGSLQLASTNKEVYSIVFFHL